MLRGRTQSRHAFKSVGISNVAYISFELENKVPFQDGVKEKTFRCSGYDEMDYH